MNRRLALACIVPALLVAGCVSRGGEAGPQDDSSVRDKPKESILVFAAASTTNALDEIRGHFTKSSGTEVQTSYAASSTLAQQIVNGADAEVFLSADAKWADHLASKCLVAQRRNLLGNRLVVVLPADSTLKVEKPEDLLGAGIEHLALGEPKSVPAGKYAKQALTRLGLWDRLQGKVVSAQDVRHALTCVETGAAEAGIVYATDAAISKKVQVAAEIPEKLTEPIRYPIVLLKHGESRAAAQAFYRHLSSPEATKVFKKYGFMILAEADAQGRQPE